MLGVVWLAACSGNQSVESAVAAWQAASDPLDEAVLDAALDKDAVVAAYAEQLKSDMLQRLEADPEILELGLAASILERNEPGLEAAARDYASARGVRGLLTRCDPRTQTDEGYASTPEVLPTLQKVGPSRAELRCTMPGSDSGAVRSIVELDADTKRWQIVRVELPLPLPTWAGATAEG